MAHDSRLLRILRELPRDIRREFPCSLAVSLFFIGFWLPLAQRCNLPVPSLSMAVMAIALLAGGSHIVGYSAAAAAGILCMIQEISCGGQDIILLLRKLQGDPVIVEAASLSQPVLFVSVLTSAFIMNRNRGWAPGAFVLLLSALFWWITDRPDAWLPMLPMAGAVLLRAMTGPRNLRLTPLWKSLVWVLSLVGIVWLLTPVQGLEEPPLQTRVNELLSRFRSDYLYSEPRDLYSLAIDGYCPNGYDELGGPAFPREVPVLEAETRVPLYLRAVSKNTYTGRSWSNTLTEHRYPLNAAHWSSLKEQCLFNLTLPVPADETLSPVRINIRTEIASSLPVPLGVRSVEAETDMSLYFNTSGEVFLTRHLTAGDSYTVLAPAAPDLTALRQRFNAAALLPDSRTQDIRTHYLALPAHLQRELYTLTAEITASAADDLEKVLAIRQWLKGNCRYTLMAEPVPRDTDFAAWFLIRTREGYCTYFATAMTLLCRIAGLPARYVEGYLAIPDSDGIARVSGADAHAWTEVWLDGCGWVTMDATPEISDQAENAPPPDSRNAEEPPPQPEEEDAPDTPPEADPQSEMPPAEAPQPEAGHDFPWWLLCLLLALTAAAAGLYLRIRSVLPAVMEKKLPPPVDNGDAGLYPDEARWQLWMQALMDLMTVLGIGRKPSESLHARIRRAGKDPRMAGLPLEKAAGICSLVIYGRRLPRYQEARLVRDICEGLISTLSRRDRLRFCLIRALIPLRKRDFRLG